VKYRSANGKYLSTFNPTIYYEEYGKGSPLILPEGGMGSIARRSGGHSISSFLYPGSPAFNFERFCQQLNNRQSIPLCLHAGVACAYLFFIPVNVLRTAPYSAGSCISYLFTIYNRGFLQYVCDE